MLSNDAAAADDNCSSSSGDIFIFFNYSSISEYIISLLATRIMYFSYQLHC